MKKLIFILIALFFTYISYSQEEKKELSNYEKYRIQKEMEKDPALSDNQTVRPDAMLQFKWDSEIISSITIFQGDKSFTISDNNKIIRLVGVLNSMKYAPGDINTSKGWNYQISMDVYEDIYIYDNSVVIAETGYIVDKNINKIFRNLVNELKPAYVSNSNDVYVYHTYSRFFRPYFTHARLYNYYYGYEWYYYDYPYHYSWHYGYSYYGYPYYRYNSYYPYYVNYYDYSRPRNGRYSAALGGRSRYYRNYSTNIRNYRTGITPKYADNSYRSRAGVSRTSDRTTRISSNVTAIQRNKKTQMNTNILRRNQRTEAPQRRTYQEAIKAGRKTYTPTYTNPRMSTKPSYNNNRSNTRSNVRNNTVITPQRRTQTRVTAPRTQSRSTIQRSTNVNRGSTIRSSRSSGGSSISRSSGTVSRSSGISRSSSSRSSGKSSRGTSGRGRK